MLQVLLTPFIVVPSCRHIFITNNEMIFGFCLQKHVLKLTLTSGKHVRAMNTPLNPILYRKTGVCRGILIFLFLLQNIGCGYSLELPRQGGSNVYTQSMFSAKIRKISKFFSRKFSIFKAQKISVYCMGKFS